MYYCMYSTYRVQSTEYGSRPLTMYYREPEIVYVASEAYRAASHGGGWPVLTKTGEKAKSTHSKFSNQNVQ